MFVSKPIAYKPFETFLQSWIIISLLAIPLACSNASELQADLPDDPMAVYEMGIEKKKSGDAAAAKQLFEHAVTMDPRIGETLAAKGRFTEAVDSYRIALTSAPDDPVTHHNLGIALMNTGEQEKALKHVNRAVQIDPEYARAIHDLGAIYLYRGKNEEALKWFKLALKKDPDYYDSYRDAAKALDALGRTDEAADVRSRGRGIASMQNGNDKK
ncbi:MAG: tetratricopeptide repeat protein [bacterium]|nr:tetratricopeptide repeat protein [bacterium]